MAGESNFVDYVKIYCRSGKGGRGSSHFRREKYIPKGGPDGGDGGDGGSIYIEANRNYWTLLHLKFNRHVMAENGGPGSGALKSGVSGKDIVIEVPCGTSVHDAVTGQFLMDVTEHGERKLLLKGGCGGKGNTFFKSPTNQAPRYAQPGEKAQERLVVLQLKTLADVGLVGFPNAGKSTLLASISAARPKIANYPFTTLEPNLGMVSYRDNRSFVVADIPGIIEGAAEGRGLGLRFLRHIERNSVLLFMISIDTEDICKEYKILCDELEKYNPGLINKKKVLAITKIDLVDDELIALIQEEIKELDLPIVFISAVAEKGMTELKDKLWSELNREDFFDHNELVHKPLPSSMLGEDGFSFNLIDDTQEEDLLQDIVWEDEEDDCLNEEDPEDE